MIGRIAAGALALALVSGAAGAAEDAAKNRISFGVERTREVENDWVTAVIGATHEDEDPARLADRINTDVAWGLSLAKAVQGLRVRTGGYRTWPIDDPKRGGLRRWRGGQDLVIEGKDPRAVSELLGRLQERLQLQDLQFSVSPERRRAVEDELIGEALDAFRARAEQIRARMQASGYTLVHVSVDTGGGPHPMPGRVAAMEMAARDVAPPPLEGGTSTLRVGANGTIELSGL
jgi:predicted secreted protein